MKEYMPGQGSYKVEEAGGLTGIGTTNNVDNSFGTLTFVREDVSVACSGVNLSLSSTFNSDHLYSVVIPRVSKGDGPDGLTSTPVPSTLMTLPADQANFYRIADGWSWNLPYVNIGTKNIFKFAPGNGKIFDLMAVLTEECMAATDGESWTEGYHVSFGSEIGTSEVYPVTIVIPEIQITIVCKIHRVTEAPGQMEFEVYNTQSPKDFFVYLADGKVLTFNSKGYLDAITDPAGKYKTVFTYKSDAILGTIKGSTSRKSFTVDGLIWTAAKIGDLITIGDETRSIFTKESGNQITVSGNFDIYLTTGKAFAIHKGQLEKIAHYIITGDTFTRCVKFYYIGDYMYTLLSSSNVMTEFKVGDQFLGRYTINSTTNKLTKFEAVETIKAANETLPTSVFDTSWLTPLQKVDYDYKITNDPTPSTKVSDSSDVITVTNNVGAPTHYYFQKCGFAAHQWNNAYFHTGIVRRGSTLKEINIDRPEFYIDPTSDNKFTYININRIDDRAFNLVSLDNYMKDENSIEFVADQAVEKLNFDISLSCAIVTGLDAALSGWASSGAGWVAATAWAIQTGQLIANRAYQQGKILVKKLLSLNAEQVSSWVPVTAVPTANKLRVGEAYPYVFADRPRQNDVYAILAKQIDECPVIKKTSRNTTRIYYAETNSDGSTFLGNFSIGDWVFLRTECRRISDKSVAGAGNDETHREQFGTYYYHWLEVETSFNFMPLENEELAIVYDKDEDPINYYVYYLNKPKVIKIESKDGNYSGENYWTSVEYEYSYTVQDSVAIDNFSDGGFTEANVEGPSEESIEPSNIALAATVITTSKENIISSEDLFKKVYFFSYDQKQGNKGQSLESTFRKEDSNWLFVNRKDTQSGRPCKNASFYGVTGFSTFEGGDIANGGSKEPRYTEDYRFDKMGRIIRTRKTSPSYEGRRTIQSWTQYVGSLDADDIDALEKFGDNPYSFNYQTLMDSKHALGLVGATIEEVNTHRDCKITYNKFVDNLNLVESKTVEQSELGSWFDLYAENVDTLKASAGIVETDDISNLRWEYPGDGNHSTTFTDLTFRADAPMKRDLVTAFTYDGTTNDLITITKPKGNTINISYHTTPNWKKSYIAKDYSEFEDNIDGTGNTQYVVNNYDYDLKGRLISKTTRFNDSTHNPPEANDDHPVSSANYPKSINTFTYDGLNRLLTKSAGSAGTTPILKNVYYDAGESGWEDLPFMVSTNYLGFRTKSKYDARYRLVRVEKFRPNSVISGNLDYTGEVIIASEENIYEPGIEKVSQSIKYTAYTEADTDRVVTQNTYDNMGRLLKVEFKNDDVGFEGDSIFRTIKEIEYDEKTNSTITKSYIDESDPANYMKSRVDNDWLGRGTIKEYSWTGVNGTGDVRVVQNSYDHVGNLVKKTLPSGEKYYYIYNNLKKLEKVEYPDGKRSSITYDVNGNVVTTIDRRNIMVTTEYNNSDMAVKVTAANVSGDLVIETKLCQFGPVSITQTEGASTLLTESFTYHRSGGKSSYTQMADAKSRKMAATFDDAGNQLTITYTDSYTTGTWPTGAWSKTLNIEPVYTPTASDHFNRTAILDNASPVITVEPNYLGLTSTLKYGAVRHVDYGYDKFLRSNSIKSDDSPKSLDMTFSRDFIGNIMKKIEMTPELVQYSYEYDGMNRLTKGDGENITYDELSNIKTRGTGTSEEADKVYDYQIVSDSTNKMRLSTFTDGGTPSSYSYDDEGNVTTISGRFAKVGEDGIIYDYLNRLREIRYSGTSQVDKYWYDSRGLRFKKMEHSELSPSGNYVTTYTMFSGETPIIQEKYNKDGIVESIFNIIGE
jgi:hypothetical protein